MTAKRLFATNLATLVALRVCCSVFPQKIIVTIVAKFVAIQACYSVSPQKIFFVLTVAKLVAIFFYLLIP